MAEATDTDDSDCGIGFKVGVQQCLIDSGLLRHLLVNKSSLVGESDHLEIKTMLAYPSTHQRPSIFGFNGVREFVRLTLVANCKVPKGTLIKLGEGKVFCFIAVLMESCYALVTVSTSLLYCQRPGQLR